MHAREKLLTLSYCPLLSVLHCPVGLHDSRGVESRHQDALCPMQTAEMPGFYAAGEYDVAGFAVGAVHRDAVIDGSRIAEGDVLLGFPSSGVHSNGFSLVRRVLEVHAVLLPLAST